MEERGPGEGGKWECRKVPSFINFICLCDRRNTQIGAGRRDVISDS